MQKALLRVLATLGAISFAGTVGAATLMAGDNILTKTQQVSCTADLSQNSCTYSEAFQFDLEDGFFATGMSASVTTLNLSDGNARFTGSIDRAGTLVAFSTGMLNATPGLLLTTLGGGAASFDVALGELKFEDLFGLSWFGRTVTFDVTSTLVVTVEDRSGNTPSPSVVPLPASLPLLAGALGLVLLNRRRSRTS